MNGTDHRSRAVRTVAAIAILAMPFAAMAQQTKPDASRGRHRAALHPAAGTATLTGTITDEATGAGIPDVEVVVGDRRVVTDEHGLFKFPDLSTGSAMVTFQRWGYQPVVRTIALDAGTNVNLSLAPKAVILLKDTQGLSHRADYELSHFGYVILFGGVASSDSIDLCKSNGERVVVDKSTIAKISGPATSVTSAPCCKIGPMLNINLTLKGGEAFTAAIFDSCSGGEEIFAARDRDTRQWVYLRFTDIAEIDFPQ